MQTKVGSVTFDHTDNFTAEVSIYRGGNSISVPFSALQQIVAESIRRELIQKLEAAKPEQLLQDKLVKKLA